MEGNNKTIEHHNWTTIDGRIKNKDIKTSFFFFFDTHEKETAA